MERAPHTSAQVASALGVHVKTVNRWARRGRLPGAYLLAGSRRLGWRVPADLLDHLAAGGYVRADGLLQPAQAPAAERAS